MAMIIAKCGLECSECLAYKATIHDSDEMRRQTAENWSKMFGANIAPESINCLGCQHDDPEKTFSHCKVCGIRSCASERGYVTCAECADFGCEKVGSIWEHDKEAKKRLEGLRS